MECWVCSKNDRFCISVVQFIRGQEQWPNLKYRCFRDGVTKMANDLSCALTTPNLVILDMASGWNMESAIHLGQAFVNRKSQGVVIFLDQNLRHGRRSHYGLHAGQKACIENLKLKSVSTINAGWEDQLLYDIEQTLAEPLDIARNRPTHFGLRNSFANMN